MGPWIAVLVLVSSCDDGYQHVPACWERNFAQENWWLPEYKVSQIFNDAMHSKYVLRLVSVTATRARTRTCPSFPRNPNPVRYVIHTNKEMAGKQHRTTWHGLLGTLVCLGYISMALFGLALLDPDWGSATRSNTFRRLHKYSGRALVSAGIAVSLLGLQTMNPDALLFYAAPAGIAAFFLVV
eukprot:GEMP01072246.1.p1 GENE.GEMP01072246.1~~GEMP01072246.1.p1  ORF type:complete len:183 (+),score=17.90 GEMP01072246.1:99-647(+)